MKGEDAVNTFDLVRKSGTLPAKLDELVPLSFIGSAAVKFYKAKVEAMKQLGIAEDQRAATLRDGQDAGECLLRIEARIGELAKSEERAIPKGAGTGRGFRPTGRAPKHERLGLAETRMRRAQEIHSHPEAVERVIAEARENEDIPTKTAVLNKIKAEKEEKKRKEYERALKVRKSENTAQTTGDALIYLSKLREVVLILPAIAPADGWSEGSFAEAQAMVEIIRKRLEAWK